MDILIRPLVTEKMMSQAETFNRVGFVVDRRATKQQIANAVKDLYDVTVVSVNTMVYGGKRKSRYTKTGIQTGRTSPFKKAIVTLAEGDTIDFYSNI